MSTFKTVLITTAVLLLGAALTVAGAVIWSQQQSIDDLSVHVYLLNQQVAQVQNRTEDNTTRLNGAIKNTNKNFSNVRDREDNIESLVKLIAKIIVAASPETSPSTFTRSKGM